MTGAPETPDPSERRPADAHETRAEAVREGAARALPREVTAHGHRGCLVGRARLHRQPLPGGFRGDPGGARPMRSTAHRAGQDPHRQAFVAALARSRVLVPIMAVATETGTTAHGLTGDNGADMAMVSITAPDGIRRAAHLHRRRCPERLAVRRPARSPWWPRRPHRPRCRKAAPHCWWTRRPRRMWAVRSCSRDQCSGRSPRDANGSLRIWIRSSPPSWTPSLTASDQVEGLSARAGERSEVDLHLQLRPGLTAEQVRTVVEAVSARLGNEQLVAERISSLRMVLGS